MELYGKSEKEMDIGFKRCGLVGLFALSVAWAWANRFVQDDAFISFRYARNLAQGNGLVWNIGERVEGYTNFLWTLCLAPSFLFGWEPVFYSYVLSLTAYVCTLVVSYGLATTLWKTWKAGVLCVFLLATNFSFSSYATGGLETQFGIAWVMTAIGALEYWRRDQQRIALCIGAGLASAFAVMTRMDAILILVPFWSVTVWRVWRTGLRRGWYMFGLAASMAAGPVFCWILWRHAYYGAWLPNTFLIKSTGVSWIRGAYYVALFYGVYGFWLAIPACWRCGRWLDKTPFVAGAAVAWVLWQLYVVCIGGDFMEFRMMMPGLPLSCLFIAGLGRSDIVNKNARRLLLAGLFFCSCLQGVCRFSYPGIQSIDELKTCYQEWKEVASVINRQLGPDTQSVKIAVTAAGIIPYYTACQTIDLLGLNDLEIAHSGEAIQAANRWLGNRPGHARIAKMKTVVERGVHLLFNKPWIVDGHETDVFKGTACELCRTWSLGHGNEQNVHPIRVRFSCEPSLPVPRVVAWPVDGSRYLMSIYVTPCPAVDEAIKRSGALVIGERK